MKWLAAGGTLLLSLLAVAVLGDGGEDAPRAAAPVDFTRACDRTASVPTQRATPRDEVLPGGVRINGFRGSFANAKPENVYSPRPGLEALKAPVVFAGPRDITIAVPRSHQAVLALDYAVARRGVDTIEEGYSSVRFRACGRHGRSTGYPGGLLYTGPWPACVPLYVSVGGRRPQRHMVSLGAGPCGGPS